ncbi:MAG: hypothetical protein GEU26_03260 [Nitrososphaeraceae archaeon]|nr:hypothetical protein [Nitrososphaeraceae archaeon]
MGSNTKFNDNQQGQLQLFSCLKSASTILMVSLVFVCVLNYCNLLSNNGVYVFAKALEYNMYEEPEEESEHFSYYSSSSVFSNLSRGLPVDAEVPNTETETLNEQEREERQNFNTNGKNQEQQP